MTYWFKRRRYGYGWTPATWQGWSLLAALIVLVLLPVPFIADDDGAGPEPWGYLFYVFVMVVLFILAAIKKGPTPHWRWGRRDGDNPDEDF
jgi:hypothetical protein